MTEVAIGVPAIPFDVLAPELERYCLTNREVRILQRDPTMQSLEFRMNQIYHVHEFSLAHFKKMISNRALSRAFKCQSKAVREALQHGLEPPKVRGRHPAISPDIEEEIRNWITTKARKQRPATRTEVLRHCLEKYGSIITRGWVDSFLLRNREVLKECVSFPIEEARLQVPRIFLDETVRCLGEYVQGLKAELVFNLDEVGISEWEDRKAKKVIVPASMAEQTIHHRANRNLKHVSVVSCISAAGESLTPYIVTSQDSNILRNLLKKRGVRFGVDFVLQHRQKPYLNAALFQDYVERIIVPYIEELRSNNEFAHEQAAILMDNCPCHMSETVIAILTQAHVRIITFAPHTTHIFQVLDLSLFGVFKRKQRYDLPIETDSAMCNFILKLYHNLKQTLTETNIWAAFRMIGFEYDIETEPYGLIFHEEKLRSSRGFVELWDIDYPPEQLTPHRRQARFGWVNQTELNQLAE